MFFSANRRRRKCTGEPGTAQGRSQEVGVPIQGACPRRWAGPALAPERRSARGVNSTLRRGGAGERRAGAGCVRPGTCHRSRVAGSMESPDAARPFVRTPLTAASVALSGHQGLGSRLRPLRRSRPLRPELGRAESAGEAAGRPAQNWGLEGARGAAVGLWWRPSVLASLPASRAPGAE